ncbi:MAG: hypothetical protein IPN71_01670 [Fibrobacteres bacterium]|nr:hypothetical protein [Fibrobacterota bacterium]
MSLADLCQRLNAEIGGLFSCEIQGDHLRLRTPYLYPDGDNIDLFFREQEGIVMVSDFRNDGGFACKPPPSGDRPSKDH